MAIYNSKYFTSEQIDERLLEGYYQDARGFGFNGNKTNYQALMSSIKTLDLSQIYANNQEVLASFTTLSNVLDVLINDFHWGSYFPLGFILEYTYEGIRYRYEIIDTSKPEDPNSWRSADSSLDTELSIDASILVGTNPGVYVARQDNHIIKGLTGFEYGSLRKIYDDLNNSTTPNYSLDNNIIEVYSAGLVHSLRAVLRYNKKLIKLHNSMYWTGTVQGDARDAFAHCISLTECLLTDLNIKRDTGVSFEKVNGQCLIGGMFYNCKSLSKVYLPNLSNVTSTVYKQGNQDIHAFSLCYRLTDLRFRGLNCDINFYDNPLTIQSITYILNNVSTTGTGKKVVLRKSYVDGYANTNDQGLFGEAVLLAKSYGWSIEVYDGIVYQTIQSISFSSTTGKYVITYTNGNPIDVDDSLITDPEEVVFNSDSVVLLLTNHTVDTVSVSDPVIQYTIVNGGVKVYLSSYVDGFTGSITIVAGGFTKTIPVSVEDYVETTTTTSTTTESTSSEEPPIVEPFTVSPSSIEVIQGRPPVVITANKPISRVVVQGYGVTAQRIDDYNYSITNNGLESSIYIVVYSINEEFVNIYTIAHTTTTSSTTSSSSTTESTEPPTPDPLEVYPSNILMVMGGVINLYSNYEDTQYSSDDLSVVDVDEYGVVTGVGVGNTQIRAFSETVDEVVYIPVEVTQDTSSTSDTTQESSTPSSSDSSEPSSEPSTESSPEPSTEPSSEPYSEPGE